MQKISKYGNSWIDIKANMGKMFKDFGKLMVLNKSLLTRSRIMVLAKWSTQSDSSETGFA